MLIRPDDQRILTTYLLGDLCTTWPPVEELPQVVAILGHDLLHDVPSMLIDFTPTVVDEPIEIGLEMLVVMKPSVKIGPKCLALLLRPMDQIDVSCQPCIAQRLVHPRVKAFSYAFLLSIRIKFIRIIGVVVLLLRSGG